MINEQGNSNMWLKVVKVNIIIIQKVRLKESQVTIKLLRKHYS